MLRAAAVLVAFSLFSVSAFASSDAEVEIRNNSSWDIHELYINTAGDPDWGPDRLGEAVIESEGGIFTLTDIPCGAYDVLLVDEDGDQCAVGDVGLCGGKGEWVIEDEALLACQAETE